MIGVAGLDRRVVRDLPAKHAAWMYALAVAGVMGTTLVGVACAYQVGLLYASKAAAGVAFVATSLFAFNVVRLMNAGMGATAALPFAMWRPKVFVVVAWWLVAAMLSQPLVTYVLRGPVEATIAARRDAVVTLHRDRVLAGLERESARLDTAMTVVDTNLEQLSGDTAGAAVARVTELRAERARLEGRRVELEARQVRAEAVDLPAFADSVRTSGFLADRIRAAWQYPVAASGLTAFFASLIALGGLLRWPAWPAVRAYEAERHRRERVLIERYYAENLERRRRLLARFPTFKKIEQWYEDPPYNTRPVPAFEAASAIEWEKLLEALRGRGSGAGG